MSKLLFQ